MKKAKIIIALIGVSLLLFSFNKSNLEWKENSSNLSEIKIGTQIWDTKNLDVSTFRNGDVIQEAKTDEEWKKAGEDGRSVWCYYNNDPANGIKYGKLYNWYAVIDQRGLAPNGWHVPSNAEWTMLTYNLGGEDVAGIKMKSSSGWYENGNGTNTSGFTGLSGGCRSGYGVFDGLGGYGYWWRSSDINTSSMVYGRNLNYDNGSLSNFSYYYKPFGLSVRCLRD